MNILLAISSMGIGGEQRAASNLTEYFITCGHAVKIITFKDSIGDKIYFNDKIEINVFDKSKNNIYRLYSIRKYIKSYNFDIVIGFGIIPSILCSLATIGLHIPVIVCERNDPDVYPLIRKIVRKLSYNFATAAIFQTNDASKYFSEKYFKIRTVIPNPICSDIKTYRKSVNNRKKVIVNISRLTPVKNQNQIIYAFSKIIKKHKDYRLELYGEGEEKHKLQDIIDREKLNNYIKINKPSENIHEIISNYQIFILTSSHEGYPNSLAEAMALGLAPISVDCRIGGPKDMIEDGINGFLIPTNDEKALVSSLEKLIVDENKRKYISRNAMKIADELNIDIIGNKRLSFIREVLELYDK